MTIEDHDRQMTTAANRERERAERYKLVIGGLIIVMIAMFGAGLVVGYRYAMDQVNQCVTSLSTSC
jgi:hypothetical protein